MYVLFYVGYCYGHSGCKREQKMKMLPPSRCLHSSGDGNITAFVTAPFLPEP